MQKKDEDDKKDEGEEDDEDIPDLVPGEDFESKDE